MHAAIADENAPQQVLLPQPNAMVVDCPSVDHILCNLMCCTENEVGKLVPLHFLDVPLFLETNPTSLQHKNLVNNITLNDWAALQKLAHM